MRRQVRIFFGLAIGQASILSCQAAKLVIELPPLDFIIHSGGC